MHRRERWYHQRDDNRLVRPFDWGLSYIVDHVNGDDPRDLFRRHTDRVMQASDDFYALPPITDYQLDGDQLTWTSAVKTPSIENNTARARFFPEKANGKKSRNAVVVLPQWNAQPESHVEACRIFNMIGMAALRLTLPYHQQRKPAELERADHLVSSNIGRTIQSMQAGGAGHSCRGSVVEESRVRARRNPRDKRRIVRRVSGVCTRAGSEGRRFQSRVGVCRRRGLARTLDRARACWFGRSLDAR